MTYRTNAIGLNPTDDINKKTAQAVVRPEAVLFQFSRKPQFLTNGAWNKVIESISII